METIRIYQFNPDKYNAEDVKKLSNKECRKLAERDSRNVKCQLVFGIADLEFLLNERFFCDADTIYRVTD